MLWFLPRGKIPQRTGPEHLEIAVELQSSNKRKTKEFWPNNYSSKYRHGNMPTKFKRIMNPGLKVMKNTINSGNKIQRLSSATDW